MKLLQNSASTISSNSDIFLVVEGD